MIKVELTNLVNKIDLDSYQGEINRIHDMIHNKTGPGNDYLGWVNLPMNITDEEIQDIISTADHIRKNYEVLVVCGIGGSYLGARTVIDALNGLHSNDSLEIIFMGQTLSTNYISQVLRHLKGKKFAINVISKSGTTTETSISFRLLRKMLEDNVGKQEAKKSIFATTDKENGLLKKLCDLEGYKTFVLPADVGGRYSVLTAVGLLPIACANIDIRQLIDGARSAFEEYSNPDLKVNECYKYASARNHLLKSGKSVEMLVTYEPQLTQLGEWFKQLYGESEGKEGKGLLPTSATFTTDLHSLGQFIQEGTPLLFETIINITKSNDEIIMSKEVEDFDELNYLEGKTLHYINEQAFLGTLKAHVEDGNVNNIILNMDELNAFSLGKLLYFFELACGVSSYMLNINPFNQPGVEVYKKNMFKLLGKK